MQALVVENNRLVARDYEALLLRYGAYTVGMAATAEEALRAAQVSRPDVALIDIRLDGPVGGLLVGETLAEEGVAVIYVSGEIDDAALWGRDHAIEILRKPIDESELKRALAAARERLRPRRT